MSLIKIKPKSPEEIQAQANAEARAYLNSTDWYVVRFAETGVAIPQDILDARQAARDSIVEPIVAPVVEPTVAPVVETTEPAPIETVE